MYKLVAGLGTGLAAVALAACGGSSTSGDPAGTFSNPKAASLVIAHVEVGCHAWLSPGGGASPTADVYLAPGGKLTVTDNDVMPHTLIGSGVPIVGADMNHMGAQSTVTFPHPGTYTFTTTAGEDYGPGVSTIGDDNHLRLTVIVA